MLRTLDTMVLECLPPLIPALNPAGLCRQLSQLSYLPPGARRATDADSLEAPEGHSRRQLCAVVFLNLMHEPSAGGELVLETTPPYVRLCPVVCAFVCRRNHVRWCASRVAQGDHFTGWWTPRVVLVRWTVQVPREADCRRPPVRFADVVWAAVTAAVVFIRTIQSCCYIMGHSAKQGTMMPVCGLRSCFTLAMISVSPLYVALIMPMTWSPPSCLNALKFGTVVWGRGGGGIAVMWCWRDVDVGLQRVVTHLRQRYALKTTARAE